MTYNTILVMVKKCPEIDFIALSCIGFCIEFYTQAKFMPQPFNNVLLNDVTSICN